MKIKILLFFIISINSYYEDYSNYRKQKNDRELNKVVSNEEFDNDLVYFEKIKNAEKLDKLTFEMIKLNYSFRNFNYDINMKINELSNYVTRIYIVNADYSNNIKN